MVRLVIATTIQQRLLKVRGANLQSASRRAALICSCTKRHGPMHAHCPCHDVTNRRMENRLVLAWTSAPLENRHRARHVAGCRENARAVAGALVGAEPAVVVWYVAGTLGGSGSHAPICSAERVMREWAMPRPYGPHPHCVSAAVYEERRTEDDSVETSKLSAVPNVFDKRSNLSLRASASYRRSST